MRFIKKPVVLSGSGNYPIWKEEILLAVRQSETDDILEKKQTDPDDNINIDMQ